MKNLIFFTILAVFFTLNIQAQTRKSNNPSQQLINFLYKTSEGKEDLQKLYQGDLNAAVKDLNVRAVNVDRDRNREYLVMRKSLCQSGDCTVTLYKQTGKTFVKLFSAPFLDVGKEWGEGKLNLISCKAESNKGQCVYYKWNKTEYVIFKCIEANSSNSTLKTKQVPCAEVN